MPNQHIERNVGSLSDQDLRAALKDNNFSAGPITDSTRELYRKKLETILKIKGVPIIDENESDLDDETSDEPFEVDEEELNESSDSYSEEVEEQEFDDSLEADEGDDNETEDSQKTPSRGRLYVVTLVSISIIAASIYLYSGNNLRVYKNLTRQFLVLLALSPIGYILYRTYRFYVTRRHEENKRVCDLVKEALELLQSPENPKGLMPILHIRDTLLTPVERKTKKTMKYWQKVVSFVEEHESRVKVELVNVDGEDFRAWKWIGTKKTHT